MKGSVTSLMVLVLFAGIPLASAQDDSGQKSSSDFFPQGFAERPGVPEEDDTGTRIHPTLPRATPFAHDPEDSFDVASSPATPSPTRPPLVDLSHLRNEQVEGVPIEALGVIVGADRAEDARQTLQSLLDLVRQKKVRPGAVVVVGTDAQVRNAEIQRELDILGILGAQVDDHGELPLRFVSIRRWPTWVVRTTEGEIVVEGINSIERQISGNGNFIENDFVLSSSEAR